MMAQIPIIIFLISWDPSTWSASIYANFWLILFLAAIVCGFLIWRYTATGFGLKGFEIDQAEIGIGSQKVSLKPNNTDKQIAYAIWVELSTRKIGLQIDFDNDVIIEVYESWYQFFAVTRELIKDIPATKLQRKSTQAIIVISTQILNDGLRPHLTKWQARFRHWYQREIERCLSDTSAENLDPQAIQAQFPKYDELKADMQRVNGTLMKYREKMYNLVLND